MGRPIHADVTSLGLTSRSGAADDNYLDIDDGNAVPVGDAGGVRLRNNAGVLEISINGAAYVPVGGGGADGPYEIGKTTLAAPNATISVPLSQVCAKTGPIKRLRIEAFLKAGDSFGDDLSFHVNGDLVAANYRSFFGNNSKFDAMIYDQIYHLTAELFWNERQGAEAKDRWRFIGLGYTTNLADAVMAVQVYPLVVNRDLDHLDASITSIQLHASDTFTPSSYVRVIGYPDL